VIAFNEQERKQGHAVLRQEYFVRAEAKPGLDGKEYRDALANNQRLSRAEGIDRALAEHTLDALVAPPGSPAWLTDFISGDFSGGGFSQPAAVAGYPARDRARRVRARTSLQHLDSSAPRGASRAHRARSMRSSRRRSIARAALPECVNLPAGS
jgi:hypothetical protein